MFIQFDIETIAPLLRQLDKNTEPQWGSMSSSQMIVHLEDILKISNKKIEMEILTPEDKLPMYIQFLESDKEMPRGFKVDFVKENSEADSIDLEKLIDSHNKELELFLSKKQEPNFKATHPLYGVLDFEQWKKLHAKHHTHHLKQFGLIE